MVLYQTQMDYFDGQIQNIPPEFTYKSKKKEICQCFFSLFIFVRSLIVCITVLNSVIITSSIINVTCWVRNLWYLEDLHKGLSDIVL